MDSPYRNAKTPQQERREAIRRELAETQTRVRDLEAAQVRARALEDELAKVETSMRGAEGKRSLPMLGRVRVAAPCPAKWEDMVGDDTTRFCGSCAKNVYDLSTMTAAEAERFVASSFGKDTCVRFYRRTDGTLLTSDCPVGTKRRRIKRVAGAALALATTATVAFGLRDSLGLAESVMGEMHVEDLGRQESAPELQPEVGLLSIPLPADSPVPPPRRHPNADPPRASSHCEKGDPLCVE